MSSERAREFDESAEAAAISGVPEPERREVSRRLFAALEEMGTPLEKLGASEAHSWLLHGVLEQFRPRDPLAAHVVPVLRALLDFAARSAGRALGSLRRACEDLIPELEEALVSGKAHRHADPESAPATTYVRGAPKIGRNDPCPCGSGRKFKKCHGA